MAAGLFILRVVVGVLLVGHGTPLPAQPDATSHDEPLGEAA